MSGSVPFHPGTLRQRIRATSLELTVESFRRSVRQIGQSLAPDADWQATLLLSAREEQLVVPLGELFHVRYGERGKDMAALAIARYGREVDAWLAGFVSTAWMVEPAGDDFQLAPDGVTVRRGLMPSEDPRRVEIVSLPVVSVDTEQMHSAEIVRRPGRPPALRSWSVHTAREMAVGGRFGNALRLAVGREPYEPKEEA